MHALRRTCGAAARCQPLLFQRPSGLRSIARAFAQAASSPIPPGAPLKKPAPPSSRRARDVDPTAPPSPTSLLLALQRSERFSRDAELLQALAGMEKEDRSSDPGPLLMLGAELWLEGLREGRGAGRQAIAEALARLAGFGGPGLFGSVCKGGEVPRRTVGAALDVLEVMAVVEDDEDADEDAPPPLPFAALAPRQRHRFTRALHEACAREVEDLMMIANDAEDDDEDDIDASE